MPKPDWMPQTLWDVFVPPEGVIQKAVPVLKEQLRTPKPEAVKKNKLADTLWDILTPEVPVPGGMAGITLRQLGKGLKAAGYPINARKALYDVIRQKIGIQQAKNIIKPIKSMKTFGRTNDPLEIVSGRPIRPELYWGYHDIPSGVGLRDFGYRLRPGNEPIGGWSLFRAVKKDDPYNYISEAAKDAAIHELFGHGAHAKLIVNRYGPTVGNRKFSRRGIDTAEDIAEAISANLEGKYHIPTKVPISPRLSNIRAKAILRAAGRK